jgi:hypothetical protein
VGYFEFWASATPWHTGSFLVHFACPPRCCWHHRSAVECRRFCCLLGSLRTTDVGKSGINEICAFYLSHFGHSFIFCNWVCYRSLSAALHLHAFSWRSWNAWRCRAGNHWVSARCNRSCHCRNALIRKIASVARIFKVAHYQ